MRVVSLICSATEIVCALGHRADLVGRSHECDYPPGIESLPVLTAPQFELGGTSAEIDGRVKDLVRDGLAIYGIDAGLLRALRPDAIVTQDQCEVCGASLADVEAAVCDWTGIETRIVSCKPNGLEDLWTDIRRVGAALNDDDAAETLVADLQSRMSSVAARAAALPERPSVATVEWIDPLMAAGHWMPELVEMAGGRNLFGEAGGQAPWIDWEALESSDPDVILVLPCGFDIERSVAEMPALTAQSGWSALGAVRNGRVYIVDGNQYFNRPGPRLAESLEILAEILHPAHFGTGWQDKGWRRYAG
ncbi:MAG: cobalamin-binding protein [Rhodospirillaceae bacterium]|nr:cobalamin-binding protein [Rhodospirillaceae bacterium]